MENLIKLLKQNQENLLEQSVDALRQSFKQIGYMTKIPNDVKCEPLNAAGVPAEWISVPESVNDHAMLYFHGGGYVAGSINSHRAYCVRLARASKTRVLLIDYRLASEHPFSAALEDAKKVYQWLISSEQFKPNKIILAGESAGGGLTIATLIKLRDDNVDLPIATVILSPFMDLVITGESVKTKAEIDPFSTRELLELCAISYLEDEDNKNPYASPLYADLQGLLPLLIQVGTSELLLDDSIRFADRAKAAGVEVTLDIWDDMIHMFQIFTFLAPEGQEAINEIVAFIQKFLS